MGLRLRKMHLLAALNRASLHLSKLAFYCHVMMLRRRCRSIAIGDQTAYFGRPILMLKRNSHFQLGTGCTLRSSLKSNGLGIKHPIIFCTLREEAELIVGDSVGISGGTFCAATSIKIGHSTLVGANVTITDTDFHPLSAAGRYSNRPDEIQSSPITIGENVFIGMGSLILKGVTIGNNSVIGAGSVVTRDIPCDVVAAGNPCVVIRKLIA